MKLLARPMLDALPHPIRSRAGRARRNVRGVLDDLKRLHFEAASRRACLRYACAAAMQRSAVQLDLHGRAISIRPASTDLRVALSCLGDEFELPIHMLANVSRDVVVLDLGAYIGASAIQFATSIPRCTVIAVEPSPENFALLQRNIAGHRNIIAVNAAVGARNGVRSIHEGIAAGQWAHTIMPMHNSAAAAPIGQVSVLSMRELIQLHCPKDKPIALVKIDIEGAELECFEDCSWMDRCAIIMIELHDRFVPGCSQRWRAVNVAAGREQLPDQGEKSLSINGPLLSSLAASPRASDSTAAYDQTPHRRLSLGDDEGSDLTVRDGPAAAADTDAQAQ